MLKSTRSRLLIGSSTRMQSKTKQKKNRKLNIYFQNDVMTQKFAHENSEKELDKGRQHRRRRRAKFLFCIIYPLFKQEETAITGLK